MSLAAADDPALIGFCERYEKVKDLSYTEAREELADYVPQSDGFQSIDDWIEECEGRQGD